ncbi:hypothetical protein IAU59_001623 [Kwoniella sp. CBS 9459]
MEAIRPQAIGEHERSSQLENEVDVLPPPPEPFPVDQLGPTAEGSASVAITVAAQPRQHVRSYLVSVQQSCIRALSSLLPDSFLSLGPNTQLAAALTDLLEVTYELDDLLPPTPNISANITPNTAHSATFEDDHALADASERTHVPEYGDSFEVLTQVLVGLHEARSADAGIQQYGEYEESPAASRELHAATQNGTRTHELHPAINVVREELAWERLESLTSAVLALSKQRGQRIGDGHTNINGEESMSSSSRIRGNADADALPPSYERSHDHALNHSQSHDNDNASLLPSYSDLHAHNNGEQDVAGDEKEKSVEDGQEASSAFEERESVRESGPVSPHREKMLHELDAVTSAIERLAAIAPRLHDQRVEMRHTLSSSSASSSKPQKLRGDVTGSEILSKQERIKLERIKMKELEDIWDKIERAHGKRRIRVEEEQRVEGAGWERRRRDRFMDKIVDQSEASRLDDQDSVMGTVDAQLARARDLRDRDHFLRDLLDQSGERRLEDQDAEGEGLEKDSIAVRKEKQTAFISDIISKTRASRLTSQDFPLTVEDRLAERRASYIESLVDYSSSGRLHDQDSMPPTPRRVPNGEREQEQDPFELVTVQDFLASGGPTRRSSLAADKFMQSPSENEDDQAGQMTSSRSRSNSVPLEEGLLRKSGSNSGTTTPTGLKKLTGMMRRGSAHLSLKVSPIDVNSISYIAEHQENLRLVQITLHGAGLSPNLELQLETASPSSGQPAHEATISSKKDPAFSLPITLPTPAIAGQTAAFTSQALHLEAKIVAQPTPPSAASLLPTYALSASDLRIHRPTALCCAVCDRELSTLPTKPTLVNTAANGNLDGPYKDLPSEHWAEMMEVWMCHNDPSFTARLAEKTKEGFWPQNGGVLVGGSYLLVGQERVKAGAIRVENGGEDNAWQSVSCICGEPAGKQKVEDNKPGSGTVRFSKWAVSLLKEDDELSDNVEHIRFPLSVFVVSDMLELSQAHASHRFIISDEETGEKRIYIWLFNPSVKMSYRRPASTSTPLPSPLRATYTLHPSSQTKSTNNNDTAYNAKSRRSSAASLIAIGNTNGNGNGTKHHKQDPMSKLATGSRVIRAAKIMYKIVDPSISESSDYDSLPGFGPGGQVETLSYPTTACDRLVSILKKSTDVYPLSNRSMGRFDIGFLERV